jgi:hypothetical protein
MLARAIGHVIISGSRSFRRDLHRHRIPAERLMRFSLAAPIENFVGLHPEPRGADAIGDARPSTPGSGSGAHEEVGMTGKRTVGTASKAPRLSGKA